MARFYSQRLAAPLFLILGIVGLLVGQSVNGHGGDVGPLAYAASVPRDLLDLGVAVVAIVVGFILDFIRGIDARVVGKYVTLVLGAGLVVLAIAGFVTGTNGFAGMHFPLPVNVVDLLAGVLGVLAGLGTLTD